MTKPDDGGPAFPTNLDDSQWYGLTIRDYFAAKLIIGHTPGPAKEIQKEVACLVYEMADAMIAERNKK